MASTLDELLQKGQFSLEKSFNVVKYFIVTNMRSASETKQCFMQTVSIGGNKDCWGDQNEARRAENRGRRPRAGVKFMGSGQQAPPHQLGA